MVYPLEGVGHLENKQGSITLLVLFDDHPTSINRALDASLIHLSIPADSEHSIFDFMNVDRLTDNSIHFITHATFLASDQSIKDHTLFQG